MSNRKRKQNNSENKGGGDLALTVVVPDEIYLKKTYEEYGIWKSLPSVMRRLSDEELEDKFGIEDKVVRALLRIKNQTQFAEEYKVNKDTLTIWNKKLEGTSAMYWIRKWAKGMIKNVMLAGYQNATSKSGTAFMDRQLLLKTVDNFEETTVVKVEGLAEGILAALKAKKK